MRSKRRKKKCSKIKSSIDCDFAAKLRLRGEIKMLHLRRRMKLYSESRQRANKWSNEAWIKDRLVVKIKIATIVCVPKKCEILEISGRLTTELKIEKACYLRLICANGVFPCCGCVFVVVDFVFILLIRTKWDERRDRKMQIHTGKPLECREKKNLTKKAHTK